MRHLLCWLWLWLCLLAFLPGGADEIPAHGLTLRRTIDLQRTTRQPGALTADRRFIYVTERTGGLNKYDAEGALLTSLPRINGNFFAAADIAQDNEYLYLTDEISKTIIKINKQLDLSSAYHLAVRHTELLSPAGLYLDKNQDIYLTDSSADLVYKINAFGVVEWRKGIFGDAVESLNAPQALTIYRNNLHVLDSGNKAIKTISPEKTTILLTRPDMLSLAAQQDQLFIGTKKGVLNYPRGKLLTADYASDLYVLDNLLYVLDGQRRKILIYEIR
ncbi:hypothetical protein NO2_0874 [Candidatus Termititenax persephonae]|uniref:SMP-30/Gluconolactonase/LRE-like region domain-containing protein n=1 Tax=Candidatus Termititenax persephonae TaxID=2218525 RepID=A0A388TGR4_9BACT|nr:hypothetical protein NO2_0874 [Candidatus Termititenax persephonae]